MDNMQICKYFKYGHCKFQERCHKKHVETICDKEDCEIKECCLRHPRHCRYFQNYGKCKFLYCSYKHENTTKQKIEQLEYLIKEKDKAIDEHEIVIKKHEKMLTDIFLKFSEFEANWNNISPTSIALPSSTEVQTLEERIATVEVTVKHIVHEKDQKRNYDRDIEMLQGQLDGLNVEFRDYECTVEGLDERVLELEIETPLIRHLDVKFHAFVDQIEQSQAHNQHPLLNLTTPPSSSRKKKPP